MSCTATADHSARCRVAHALQTSNQRVPFLANPLDPDGARHMAALTIMWRVQPSRSRARQVDGSREKVHAESPRVQMSKMTVLWLWGGMPRVQHAVCIPVRGTARVLQLYDLSLISYQISAVLSFCYACASYCKACACPSSTKA